MPDSVKPYAGLLIVSLEQAVAAPLASCHFAQGGARVIKVEREDGDFARKYDRAAKGASSYFVWANHGKDSLCLDIKDPVRSEEHTSELQSLMRNSYAVFCLKKKKHI